MNSESTIDRRRFLGQLLGAAAVANLSMVGLGGCPGIVRG